MKNYLFDLYSNFPNEFTLDNRIDPDSCSKDLYDDLQSTFFSSNAKGILGIASVENRVQKFGRRPAFYTLFVDTDKFLLSSDYIGPSIYWARKAGLTCEEIISVLEISRTLGGHIVFPRGEGNSTVNQARGGEKGYYDRIDLTLFAIKQLFEKKEISNELMEKAWKNYSDWFDLFGKEENAFKAFVDFFKLNDFVDEKYEIYDLTTFDSDNASYSFLCNDKPWIPNNPTSFKKYANGTNYAIMLRNKRL